MDLDRVFSAVVEQQASDVFLKVGAPAYLRIRGRLQALGPQPLSRADLLQFAYDLMGPERQQVFQAQRELNFAFERDAAGRFRANVLWQRGNLALVIRRIHDRIPSFEDLNLPAEVLRRFAKERQGLVLITGPTGNGKSTTVAATLECINQTSACHIVTLEDPIEFLFEEKQAVINQREIGVDTRSFSEGLKNVFRQSPDVLFLSDLRDRETTEAALLAAEAGQLVLSCIHATNAMTTVERLVACFPPTQQSMIRFRLSLVLNGVLSLRLVPRCDGPGQVPACEVLVMTPTVRELIREGRSEQLPHALHEGAIHGMQTMTQALYQLIRKGWISVEAALAVSEHPDELQRAIREIRAIRDARDSTLT
ncbi:MAG: PilT/PilU family type 4a pilus ATPase [Candidatus Omnitrophica bacterium]|nr:PilT/PilU family type 4a pilus ATPase [Candidatus Omnitrophota bacterium]